MKRRVVIALISMVIIIGLVLVTRMIDVAGIVGVIKKMHGG